MRFDDINWGLWEPQERATILFVVRDGQILLIRKKRGLGAGKVNGPGGRIEPSETPLEGAVREVQEELLVTPTGVRPAGSLRFQFVDGFSMSVRVFIASGCEGEAQETDEALPMWTSTDAVPYSEMWPDDAYWLPLMLKGARFEGRFLLDGDTLLGHDVQERVAVECPKCGNDERIVEHGQTVTAMGFSPFWSASERHVHNPNKVTMGFSCPCGEFWSRSRYNPCPACGQTSVLKCSDANPCCDRAGEYDGYASGAAAFTCPKSCLCHN